MSSGDPSPDSGRRPAPPRSAPRSPTSRSASPVSSRRLRRPSPAVQTTRQPATGIAGPSFRMLTRRERDVTTPSVINLRSDTQTLPTERMRRAMAEAPLGDDTYGEDPTVLRFEAMAAERLGTEAAMLVLSGTMANLIALLVHCRPADELFVDAGAHVVYYESGGLAAVAGVTPTIVASDRGHILPDALQAAIRRPNIHYPHARLVWLENTHNRGAGSVMRLDQQR